MDKDIAITGEPTINPATCKFTVDRPVYTGGSAYFGNRETASLSPLARRIFEIPEVQDVLIVENQVTVTKSGIDPWPLIGKQIGAKIREHIHSNDPAVSPQYESAMPSESGGFVELLDVKKNSVYLRLGGGCQGCQSANLTLKMGIERVIREQIPEVGEVLDATDHAAGRNPYYQS